MMLLVTILTKESSSITSTINEEQDILTAGRCDLNSEANSNVAKTDQTTIETIDKDDYLK